MRETLLEFANGRPSDDVDSMLELTEKFPDFFFEPATTLLHRYIMKPENKCSVFPKRRIFFPKRRISEGFASDDPPVMKHLQGTVASDAINDVFGSNGGEHPGRAVGATLTLGSAGSTWLRCL